MTIKRKNVVLTTAVVILLFFLSPLPGAGDAGEGKTFTAKQLKDDFTILRNALEEGHGGMYRYTPKKELDQIFDDIHKNVTQPLTEFQFFKKLLPLIAAINDGHTGINTSPDLTAYLEKQPVLFPFNLRFIKNKAYLFRNYSEKPGLPLGAEIISINGHPIPEIIEKLLPNISSDAHIQTSKFRKLESTVFFGKNYMFIYGKTTAFSFKYKTPEKNNIQTAEVKGISVGETNSRFAERYPKAAAKNPPPFSLEYKENIPVLTIRTFSGIAYEDSKIAYHQFLANAFKEFNEKKVKNLIIDLRGNGGGNDDYGKMPAAYLMDKPFQYYKALEIKNNTFDFLKYTDVPPQQRTIPESICRKNARGWYDMLRHPNLGEQKPLKPTFKGKVFILLDGRSFSATGETTSIIHFHKKALFVGEECGSGYYGNTSGRMTRLTLPNTGLRIRIPLVRYTMAVSGYPADRGIIPDYPVSRTIQDLLNEKDTQLEYTINLIKKK